jgi:hypothetical protein
MKEEINNYYEGLIKGRQAGRQEGRKEGNPGLGRWHHVCVCVTNIRYP